MRAKLPILTCLLALYGTSASATTIPGQDHLSSPLQYPGAPKPVYDDNRPPYAMNYAEEAAQSLGVRNGRMDVFSIPADTSGYMPSISGGLGGDGAMIRFRWHPGE